MIEDNRTPVIARPVANHHPTKNPTFMGIGLSPAGDEQVKERVLVLPDFDRDITELPKVGTLVHLRGRGIRGVVIGYKMSFDSRCSNPLDLYAMVRCDDDRVRSMDPRGVEVAPPPPSPVEALDAIRHGLNGLTCDPNYEPLFEVVREALKEAGHER